MKGRFGFAISFIPLLVLMAVGYVIPIASNIISSFSICKITDDKILIFFLVFMRIEHIYETRGIFIEESLFIELILNPLQYLFT